MLARRIWIYFQKVTKIEELQNNLQALVGVTELLIKYSRIVQAVPPSFIKQLRNYNQSDGSRKYFNFFRKGSSIDEQESVLVRQLRTTLPAVCSIINESKFS